MVLEKLPIFKKKTCLQDLEFPSVFSPFPIGFKPCLALPSHAEFKVGIGTCSKAILYLLVGVVPLLMGFLPIDHRSYKRVGLC